MLLVLVSIAFNSLAQLSLKYGAANTNESLLSIFKSPAAYLSVAFYGFSIMTWFMALKTLPLNTTFPMQAIGYVLVFGLSSVIFHEKVSFVSLIGLVIMCIGVVTLRFGAS